MRVVTGFSVICPSMRCEVKRANIRQGAKDVNAKGSRSNIRQGQGATYSAFWHFGSASADRKLVGGHIRLFRNILVLHAPFSSSGLVFRLERVLRPQIKKWKVHIMVWTRIHFSEARCFWH